MNNQAELAVLYKIRAQLLQEGCCSAQLEEIETAISMAEGDDE